MKTTKFMCRLLANYSKELSEAQTYREKGDVQLKHANLIIDKVKDCSFKPMCKQKSKKNAKKRAKKNDY